MLFIYYYRKLYLKRKGFRELNPFNIFLKTPIIHILEKYQSMYESKYLNV